MSRRTKSVRRNLIPDSKYDSTEVTKFINNLMVDGKKSLAEKIFYGALDICEEKSSQPGLNIFKQALTNAKPSLEVKSRRVGGATYQVPIEVQSDRKTALASRWLISFARNRGEKTMAERLAYEFLAASRSEGDTIKKKKDTHRMAEANRAFVHYRW